MRLMSKLVQSFFPLWAADQESGIEFGVSFYLFP